MSGISGDSLGAQISLTDPRLGTSVFIPSALTAAYPAVFYRSSSERQIDSHNFITVWAFKFYLSGCAADLIQDPFAAVWAQFYDLHFVVHVF